MKQTIILPSPSKKDSVTIKLNKDGDEQEILSVFIGTDADTYSLKTLQHHHGTHTQSYCMVRGVLFDQSQADISGLIKIDKGAQHTDAFLEEKTLLIGNTARATAEPQLEIEADEVKASHAATVGQLDPEQLFYLRSRGISFNQAQTILVRGFLQPVLDRIENKKKRKEVETEIETHIQRSFPK